MPAETPFGVPYPEPTDPVQLGADDIRKVAEELDERVLAGRLEWGPAAAAADVVLWRAGPRILVGETAIRSLRLALTDEALSAQVGGTLYFSVRADGRLEWLGDTSLYRPMAGVLAGSSYSARHGEAGQVYIGPTGGGFPAIQFGPAYDANLYRAGAGLIKSDGELVLAGGKIHLQSAGINAIYFGTGADTALYRASAGRLDVAGQFWIGAEGAPAAAHQTGLVLYFYGLESRRLEAGAPDSGGTGYRVVRIPN